MRPHPALAALFFFLAVAVALAVFWRWFQHRRLRIVRRSQAVWRSVRRRHPRLATFIAARFARGEYLGLHLTIGLGLTVLALWIFGAITEDVVMHEPLTRFDIRLLEALHRHATPSGITVFLTVSKFGAPLTLTLLAAAGALLLVARREWIILGGWVAAFAGGGVLDQWLKLVIRRPRPSYAAALLPHPTWSFPSGHAMGAFVGYGMLAYVLVILWEERRSTQIAIIGAIAVLVVAIGVSRLYLGVHYFSDVIGGFAAGMLWLSVCISGIEVARRWTAARRT